MLRPQALGSNTPSGVPYTKEEINAQAQKGKQRGRLPGIGRVLLGRATDVLILPPPPPPQCTHNSADVENLKKKNKYLTKQVNLMMKLFKSDDKFSQMLTHYESTPEFGNASGSGWCGDDEMADDEDGGEDEDVEEDEDIARESRPGNYPWRAFPFNLSRATCRPGLVSLATSRPGRRGFVAGDSAQSARPGGRVGPVRINGSQSGQFSGELSGQETTLPYAFNAMTLQDPSTSNWNMDTFSVGDGYSIPITNSGHSILSTPHRPLHLNNDFLTRRVILRYDSTGDLYPVTKSSSISHAFLTSHSKLSSVDVDEAFRPVVKLCTIRTIFSLAISRYWHVHQLDVKNAFLHGDFSETIYMHQLPGFWDFAYPDYVCFISNWSSYGLEYAIEILEVAAILVVCNSSGLLLDNKSKWVMMIDQF
ncbi:zinc finger, CCHC-type containing protein [Tanacetum coccineum]|uniref:Zinc finger, CCHC-type containing protein n=1 Tax=Tanacetum coccineum TaxID=301880 RepID=A0ABQ4WZ88_9ASTR